MTNKPEPNQNPDAAEASAPELLERLVRQAELAGASDIHLQMRGDIADVAFRLDAKAPLASRPPIWKRIGHERDHL